MLLSPHIDQSLRSLPGRLPTFGEILASSAASALIPASSRQRRSSSKRVHCRSASLRRRASSPTAVVGSRNRRPRWWRCPSLGCSPMSRCPPLPSPSRTFLHVRSEPPRRLFGVHATDEGEGQEGRENVVKLRQSASPGARKARGGETRIVASRLKIACFRQG